MAANASQAPLEDQLRSMILGNGTLGTNAHVQNSSPHGASASPGWRQHQRPPPGLQGGPSNGNHQSGQPISPFQQQAPRRDPSQFQNGQRQSWQSGRGNHHQGPHYRAPSGPQVQSIFPMDPRPQVPANGPRKPSPGAGRGGPQKHSSVTPSLTYNGKPTRILQRPQPAEAPMQNFARGQKSHYNGPYNQRLPRAMAKYLDSVAAVEVAKAAMHLQELRQKEEFTIYLERFCQAALADVGGFPRIELKCFGSIKSGFATTGSDIDLAVIFADNEGHHIASEAGEVKFKFEIFRALEKALLEKGHGARLLTRTRVPILKFCESPTDTLFANLLAERQKWEALPDDQKYANVEEGQDEEPVVGKQDSPKPSDQGSKKPSLTPSDPSPTESILTPKPYLRAQEPSRGHHMPRDFRREKVWLRERPKGPLDYPKDGVGIQCDLNFDNPLGIYNSKLLHLYSLCDPRVRDMVIFVKAWAKRRKINSAYNGTLCSYGYVLMVLHFLINVVKPPVLPDLLRDFDNSSPHKQWPTPKGVSVTWKGTKVNFWADEEYITNRAKQNGWTQNRDSVGGLLCSFFQYYAHQGYNVPMGGFIWKQDAICFTGPRPVVPKSAKGWTAAKTEMRQNKQIRLRYLLAIVDPFETDHNVARTVTHHGIVAIRDEFRRAWDILNAAAGGRVHEELFASREDEENEERVAEM